MFMYSWADTGILKVTKLKAALFLAVLVLFTLGLSRAPKATAAKAVTFTVTVQSAFLRSGPGLSFPRVYSVKQDQVYAVLGRNADASWLKLDYAGAASEAWVIADFGKVGGDVSAVPVLAATGADAPTPANAPTGPSTNAPTGALPHVDFTILVKSTFARSAPSFSAPRVYSLFKGQIYRVLARSADAIWLQIDFPTRTTDTWVIAAYGATTGDLGGIPIFGAPPASIPIPAPTTTAPTNANPAPAGVMPTISSHMREVYQYGLRLGNNPRAFSKVGDCNSVTPYFLATFDFPKESRLDGPYASLQEAVRNFSSSFSRESLATHVGFSAATVLDSTWADHRVCQTGENALACEYRLNRPSIVFISLGTNSVWQTDADYEASLRRILQFFLARGVVPILSTKADNLEGGGRFNQIVTRLAREYDVPLWDFQLAVQGLPNSGLTEDNFHLVWRPSIFTSPADVQTGWQWRNLTALQALDKVWKTVR